MIAGKNILLGVTGSIAAYQTVDLVGLLKRNLAEVRVILTRAALEFITPLSLKTVSGYPVVVDMFSDKPHPTVEHIDLARGADLVLIAPATANIIGKIASGIADDMLSTVVMATKAPVLIAPAMNENMYKNPIVQSNLNKLQDRGYHFVGPEYGEMACGGEGWGRLARLDVVVNAVIEFLKEET